jgi:hypothetical protein
MGFLKISLQTPNDYPKEGVEDKERLKFTTASRLFFFVQKTKSLEALGFTVYSFISLK